MSSEQFFSDPARDTVGDRPFDRWPLSSIPPSIKGARSFGSTFDFAHGPAHIVRLGRRSLPDPGRSDDLFLIDDDPVGHFEDGFQERPVIADFSDRGAL